MHVTVRYLTSDIHPFEVAFFRNILGCLILTPWLLSLERGTLATKRIGLHVVRAVFNSIAMLAWYVALSLLPVADAVSLTLVGPVFVALGAMWFLGESVTRRRWLGILIATAGAMVIIRPGFESVGIGTALVLVSTATVSVSRLVAKSLSRTDRTPTIVGYLSLLMTPMTLIPALSVWTWPTLEQFGLLALVGGLGTVAHILYIRAYKAADVSRVEPAMFMRVVWAALIGLVVFAEFPDIWTWVGAAIVVSGTTYIARKEPVRSQHAGESLP
jgi:drug/metabolite transporter (DMT)-like permease